jgi:hypothetical protein
MSDVVAFKAALNALLTQNRETGGLVRAWIPLGDLNVYIRIGPRRFMWDEKVHSEPCVQIANGETVPDSRGGGAFWSALSLVRETTDLPIFCETVINERLEESLKGRGFRPSSVQEVGAHGPDLILVGPLLIPDPNRGKAQNPLLSP